MIVMSIKMTMTTTIRMGITMVLVDVVTTHKSLGFEKSEHWDYDVYF